MPDSVRVCPEWEEGPSSWSACKIAVSVMTRINFWNITGGSARVGKSRGRGGRTKEEIIGGKCAHKHLCARVYMHMCGWVHAYVCVYIYLFIYTYIHIYLHIYIYIHTHTNTHIYTHSSLQRRLREATSECPCSPKRVPSACPKKLNIRKNWVTKSEIACIFVRVLQIMFGRVLQNIFVREILMTRHIGLCACVCGLAHRYPL